MQNVTKKPATCRALLVQKQGDQLKQEEIVNVANNSLIVGNLD